MSSRRRTSSFLPVRSSTATPTTSSCPATRSRRSRRSTLSSTRRPALARRLLLRLRPRLRTPTRSKRLSMAWLVVGLGNPGPTYASHRHNVGAMVVAELARRAGVTLSAHALQRANTGDVRIGPNGVGAVGADTEKAILATSRTYMNEFGGGDNGHNGLKSIRGAIGTGDYYRIRWGVGR